MLTPAQAVADVATVIVLVSPSDERPLMVKLKVFEIAVRLCTIGAPAPVMVTVRGAVMLLAVRVACSA